MPEEILATVGAAPRQAAPRQDTVSTASPPDRSAVTLEDDHSSAAHQGALTEEAVEDLNEVLRGKEIALQFSIDESAHEIVVKVTDKRTGDVIRQIPPEEQLRIAAHLRELLGVLLNETA